MDPLLTVSMAATGGALATSWPAIALLRRARRQLRRAQRALDHDDLTGLANRRAFTTYLSAVRAAGRRTAVVLVDLDRFKQVNDRYGHHAGDAVLCQVADRLRSLGGDVRLAARLAGDEFVLVVDADTAAMVTERIREAIREAPYIVGDHRIPVSASVGFAVTGDPDDQGVLRRADLAMYQDKATGRQANALVRETGTSQPHDTTTQATTQATGRRPQNGRRQRMPLASQPAGTPAT